MSAKRTLSLLTAAKARNLNNKALASITGGTDIGTEPILDLLIPEPTPDPNKVSNP